MDNTGDAQQLESTPNTVDWDAFDREMGDMRECDGLLEAYPTQKALESAARAASTTGSDLCLRDDVPRPMASRDPSPFFHAISTWVFAIEGYKQTRLFFLIQKQQGMVVDGGKRKTHIKNRRKNRLGGARS
nr:hypothetical protein [Pandoravirus massiliensis]